MILFNYMIHKLYYKLLFKFYFILHVSYIIKAASSGYSNSKCSTGGTFLGVGSTSCFHDNIATALFILVVIVFVSLILEACINKIRSSVKCPQMKKIVNRLFEEIMILGFISMALFVLNTTGIIHHISDFTNNLTSSEELHFQEFFHYLVFLTMIFYIIIVFILLMIGTYVPRLSWYIKLEPSQRNTLYREDSIIDIKKLNKTYQEIYSKYEYHNENNWFIWIKRNINLYKRFRRWKIFELLAYNICRSRSRAIYHNPLEMQRIFGLDHMTSRGLNYFDYYVLCMRNLLSHITRFHWSAFIGLSLIVLSTSLFPLYDDYILICTGSLLFLISLCIMKKTAKILRGIVNERLKVFTETDIQNVQLQINQNRNSLFRRSTRNSNKNNNRDSRHSRHSKISNHVEQNTVFLAISNSDIQDNTNEIVDDSNNHEIIDNNNKNKNILDDHCNKVILKISSDKNMIINKKRIHLKIIGHVVRAIIRMQMSILCHRGLHNHETLFWFNKPLFLLRLFQFSTLNQAFYLVWLSIVHIESIFNHKWGGIKLFLLIIFPFLSLFIITPITMPSLVLAMSLTGFFVDQNPRQEINKINMSPKEAAIQKEHIRRVRRSFMRNSRTSITGVEKDEFIINNNNGSDQLTYSNSNNFMNSYDLPSPATKENKKLDYIERLNSVDNSEIINNDVYNYEQNINKHLDKIENKTPITDYKTLNDWDDISLTNINDKWKQNKTLINKENNIENNNYNNQSPVKLESRAFGIGKKQNK